MPEYFILMFYMETKDFGSSQTELCLSGWVWVMLCRVAAASPASGVLSGTTPPELSPSNLQRRTNSW